VYPEKLVLELKEKEETLEPQELEVKPELLPRASN